MAFAMALAASLSAQPPASIPVAPLVSGNPLIIAGLDGRTYLYRDHRLRCAEPEELVFECTFALPADFRARNAADILLSQEGRLATFSYSGSMTDYDAVSALLTRTYGRAQHREGLDHTMREAVVGWSFDGGAWLTLNRAADGFAVLVSFPENMAISSRFSRPADRDMRWALVSAGQRSPAIFVEQRHIAVAGPLRTVWLREAFDRAQADGTIRRHMRITFNCALGRSALLAFQRIDANSRVLEERALEMEQISTQPIRRGSTLDRAKTYVCRLPVAQIEAMRRP